jgi:hypothetical protein
MTCLDNFIEGYLEIGLCQYEFQPFVLQIPAFPQTLGQSEKINP